MWIGGCKPAPPRQTPDEQEKRRIIEIAKKAVADRDDWADRAVYTAHKDGTGWMVYAERIVGYDASGQPQFVIGGDRLIKINKDGIVTAYIRGL
jgi:hypothetical protein